jgi:hypothetical protein
MKELSSHADAGKGFPVQAGSKDERYIGVGRWEPAPIEEVPKADEGSQEQQQAPKYEREEREAAGFWGCDV